MKFKNLTCLKKVWENQAETKMLETEILFNDSIVTISGSRIESNLTSNEVLFLFSSNKERKESSRGKRPEYDITIHWVECYTDTHVSKEVHSDITGLILITKPVYLALQEQFITDKNIYEEILKQGIPTISTNLVDIKDFCAITCSIVE